MLSQSFYLFCHSFLPHHRVPSNLGDVQNFWAKFITGGCDVKRKGESDACAVVGYGPDGREPEAIKRTRTLNDIRVAVVLKRINHSKRLDTKDRLRIFLDYKLFKDSPSQNLKIVYI